MIGKDWRRAAPIAGALVALALLGFFVFPGHTYLQSDTQIYIPIFERMENANLYARDILVGTAHIGLTIYDETAIGLHRLTHGSFEDVLAVEQIAFRVLGLWGVFLIATSCGLSDAAALLMAACYGLGATIVGPAVLSVEYEPVPRGFAVALVLLAVGLLMHGRYTWACTAASVGFLYHSPATIPFWILFCVLVVRGRRWRSLLPLAAATAVLALTFTAQRSLLRPQPFLAIIDSEWEQVIRMRTAYDWIGEWPSGSVFVVGLYCVVALAALWRIRGATHITQRLILGAFPLIGLASIAASWVLLDVCKWAVMAQVQPARAALFTIVFAQLNCGLAGLLAVKDRRWQESLLWFAPVFLPPVISQPLGATFPQLATVGLLTLIAVSMFTRVRWLAAPAIAVAGCWAIPHLAHTINYPTLHSVELNEISAWARTHTPEQAMFVFPGSGRNLDQGVFRAKSLRGLYIDWKAGGQVNYFRDFALEWRKRWAELSGGKLTADDWRTRGVDYLIYSGARNEQLGLPVYENSDYRVYRIARQLTPPH